MENAFGEEVSRRTQRGLSTAFCYDSFGRLTGLYEENGASQGPNSIAATLWNYGENAPLKGLLTSVTHPNQTVSYNYDTCQRVVGETVQIQGGGVYTTQYTYDGASRTASVTYPSGVVTNYTYNAIGYQRMQTDASGQVLYKTNRTNPLGQMERFTLGNGMVSSLEYDPETHLLAAIRTKKGGLDIQNLLLDYDGFCNLAARKDNLRNMEERFTYTDTYARPMFDRGFTGHEHLQAFGLINMNGRMYDPVMSSFLSVDRYIQSPGNDQDFNRYAYCMYNPLKYVDPSGERCVGMDMTLYYERMAREYVHQQWFSLYDMAMESNRLTAVLSSCLFSHGEETNGSGNHGTPGGDGGNQNGPTSQSDGDGDPTNTTNSSSDGIPGSSEDNPTSSYFLTTKCDLWYNWGNGTTMYVIASDWFLCYLSQSDLIPLGNNKYTINLFTWPYMIYDPQTSQALGQITLTDMGNNMFHIEDDTYDFNVKNGMYFSNWRNFATSGAGILHGGINEPTFLLYPATYWGGEFNIHFINDVYIRP